MTVDELQVLITANSNQLQKEINTANKKISSIKTTAKTSSNATLSAFKTLKTGIIALGIGKVIKDSITNGMEAIESDNLFSVSLGKYADEVYSWSNEVATALGLNAVEIRKNTGTIYNMTSSMGLAEKQALTMSKGITMLANDMASFYNLNTDEAFTKLRSGITGETEPLKQLGILVDENTIKQVAYSEGIARNGAELSQQQKVLARYVAILKQTGNAQGDLARTLDSPANMFRRLSAEIKNCTTALGSIFMPILQTVLPYIISFVKVINTGINALTSFLGVKSNNGLASEMGTANENAGGLASNMNNANASAKKLKNTLAGFDEITNLTPNTDDTATGGAGNVSGSLDFDLSEYDAGISGIEDKTNEIVQKITDTFSAIDVNPLLTSLTNVSNALEPLKSDVFNGLKWGYENVLKPVASWTITDLLPTFFNTTSEALGLLNTVIDECKPAFSWLWDKFLLPIATWTGGVIVGVLESIGNMCKFLSENIELVEIAVVGLTTAWLTFKGLGIIASIVQFVKYSGALAGTTGLGAVISAFQQLGTYLSGAWASVVAVAKGGLTALTGGLTALASALGISVGALLGIIAVVALVAVGIYELVTNWDVVKNFFLTTVPEWWNSFKQMVLTAWEGVKTWFAELPYNIGHFLGEVLATIVLWGINVGNELVKFFTETIPTKFNEFMTWLGTSWQNIKNWFAGIPSYLHTFFTVTIPTKFNELINYIKGLPAKFIEMGKNIVQGIIDGITQGWTNLKEKWDSFIDGFVTGFKEKLGIHSPSRVFSDLATFITDGIKVGIGDGNGAFDGLNSLSGENVEEIKNSWTGIADWFTTNVTSPLTETFEMFSVQMTNIFDGINNMIKGQILLAVDMMNILIGCLQTTMNSVVKSVNRIIRSINATAEETGISLPYAKTETLEKVPVPKLARGGIVDKPTIAMIGEQGKEAVIPLENNTEWLDKVAGKVVTMLMGVQNNDNDAINVNLSVNLDSKTIARETIKELNKEAIRLGYKPLLNI